MKEYYPQLVSLIDFLHQKLCKEVPEERSKMMSALESIKDVVFTNLHRQLATKQDEEASLIRTCIEKSSPNRRLRLLEEKKELLEKVSHSLNSLTNFNVDLIGSFSSFSKGFNGSFEHTTLMFLALHNAFKNNENVLVEYVALCIPQSPTKNHGFIVVNRNTEGQLSDVNSWGEGCIVIDGWREEIFAPRDMPEGSSVYNLLHFPGVYKIQVRYDNQFGLDQLNVSSDSIHHTIIRITRDFLQGELDKLIEKFNAKFNLPQIKNPITDSALQSTNGIRFFAASASGPETGLNVSKNEIPPSLKK